MNAFIAVVLVCANAVPQEACTDERASEVRKVRVANELGCTSGWQEIIARTDLRDEVGTERNLNNPGSVKSDGQRGMERTTGAPAGNPTQDTTGSIGHPKSNNSNGATSAPAAR